MMAQGLSFAMARIQKLAKKTAKGPISDDVSWPNPVTTWMWVKMEDQCGTTDVNV